MSMKEERKSAGIDCRRCQGESLWSDDLAQEVVHGLCASYEYAGGVSYMERCGIPQQEVILRLLQQLLELLFPGYSGRYEFHAEGQFFTVGEMLNQVQQGLTDQIAKAYAFRCSKEHCDQPCRALAQETVMAFLRKLPAIREVLLTDAQAALDGDPAASTLDEIILAYPGFKCISIHRLAHELYKAKVPLIPRVMSEYAHAVTGIDINPGATIGAHFFIDHGTGVVIGETAIIGEHVKLYQGVTLGALSFPKDACGKLVKGAKRHPNIEDYVTIYAEATILGDVTIGHHSVIGGNVWLTETIPPYSKVTHPSSKLSIQTRNSAPRV
ncbi:MAG: serine acetyltransferase [Lentisphaerae bacterium]|jgi:serine O-acetyltransferase|nr:serine acetyltransferase [Lentisphaerota bacterium]